MALLLLLRNTPPQIILADSAYIPAGGNTTTTGQLASPNGKDSGSFQTGKISDDTNPLPSIDLEADKYTELEWCIKVTDEVQNDEIYEFRVTAAGAVLDTYTLTPQWTIGTGIPPEVSIPINMYNYRKRRV